MEDKLHEIVASIKRIANLNGNSNTRALSFNWNKEGKWDVYIYDFKEKQIRKITSGKDSYLNPNFSHSGKEILYLKDKEGDENFQVILRNLKSDEEIQLTNDLLRYRLKRFEV
ncbi:MAG: hypothetical protein RQ952_04285 [Thermoproteota archaeon]|jgi:Tol biopolymer transport system component|nr:hypothetical protein [Thermoproteota archaeon]